MNSLNKVNNYMYYNIAIIDKIRNGYRPTSYPKSCPPQMEMNKIPDNGTNYSSKEPNDEELP